MKTYDARMESIMKKANKRKLMRICVKSLTSLLCFAAVIVGIMYIPFGSHQAGVSPTTTNTTPSTSPNTTPSTYPSHNYELLQLDADRMALIEETWAKEYNYGFSDDMRFCDPDTLTDGIRYYGSFEKLNYNGQVLTFDILYIPCESLPVPTKYTIGEHTLRSRTAFGLYVFLSNELKATDVVLNTISPINEFIDSETGAPEIEYEILAAAAELHSAYESIFYGSELSELPEEDPADSLLRLNAAWLLHFGDVTSFNTRFESRYYGNFSGYEIVFVPGNLTWKETQTIGGESFTYSSSFQLYAYKDWKFYKLKDVYEQGLITDEDIAQLAKIHSEWKYN